MAEVNGCTRSLGGKETLGPLVVARIPSAIVPVCVVKSVSAASVLQHEYGASVMASVSEIACVSACGELIRGRFQTRDGCGEPFAPYRVIVEIAPVSRDVANEACSAFTERPSRARIRAGIPVRERPAFRKRWSRGRLKWRRGLGEFETRGFPRGRVFGALRAAYRGAHGMQHVMPQPVRCSVRGAGFRDVTRVPAGARNSAGSARG